ncbi:MAG: alpha/beta hydrolase [Candidatus Omnitrophica bacterium]|nr:alpha/beta hydrolase [Candidatus Omnitrophota bacterium]
MINISKAFLILLCLILASGCIRGKFGRVNIQAKALRVKDIEIAYKELGFGYPLVLIMGYGASMDLWDPGVLKELSSRYKVIIFDNRGVGKSSATDKEFTIELFADDTLQLIDALGIKQAHVLGYSMGTNIAQELALNHPEKVSKLILVEGDCGGKEAISAAPDVFFELTDTTCPPEERVKRLISLLLPEKWLKAHPDVHNYLPFPEDTVSIESINRQTKAMEDWKGSFSRLTKITQPTLLITGTEDIVTPPANSFLMVQRIPGAWLVQIEGGGHGLMYQYPKKFSDIILSFLEE